ncbi:MAG: hypothetical protein GY852_06485 [bacterium]|nr:hypothetical protein [bacterium]
MQGRAGATASGNSKRVGGNGKPHAIHDQILFSRGGVSSERITKTDLMAGRKLLSELSEMKYPMRERARVAYLNGGKTDQKTELKKIAYGLAVLDFVKAVNKRAEKSSTTTSGDYQIFCGSVSVFTSFFTGGYFSEDLEKNALSLYMVESALEACSEIYGMGALLFEETSARYTEKAREFVEKTKKEDTALKNYVALRINTLEERLENDKEGLRKEVADKILKKLKRPGTRGIKYQMLTRMYDGASVNEPTEEFVLFGKHDTEKALSQKLASVGDHYILLMEYELDLLEKIQKKFKAGLPINANDREAVARLKAGEHDKRIKAIR